MALAATVLGSAADGDVTELPSPGAIHTARTARPSLTVIPVGDTLTTDVHEMSCLFTSTRPIDWDPAAGVVFVALRANSDSKLYYYGTGDGGASWTQQGPLVNAAVRFPAALADPGTGRPHIFYTRGWQAADEGAYAICDEGGYNTGIWSVERAIDTLGRGVPGAALSLSCPFTGTGGSLHVLANYWAARSIEPDGACHYRSDDGGATWPATAPRGHGASGLSTGTLKMYNLPGTEDSLALFGGGPVYHDSLLGGITNHVQLFGTASGETLMIGSFGVTDTSDRTGDRGRCRFWYRLSHDNGDTWTPFAWAPYGGWLGWPGPSYDMGIAVDVRGHPHFATFLWMDTADGGYGPRTGIYDYHRTDSGWAATQVCTTNYSAGRKAPCRFCTFGAGTDGRLWLSYCDGTEHARDMDVYLACSADGGATYGEPLCVTEGCASGSDYPHIPMHIPAWSPGLRIPVFMQREYSGCVRWQSVTGIGGRPPGGASIAAFRLNPPFPNPVRGSVALCFTLPHAAPYTVTIVDIAGRTVRTIAGNGLPGANVARWDGRSSGGRRAASGVYLYRLICGRWSANGRMVILR